MQIVRVFFRSPYSATFRNSRRTMVAERGCEGVAGTGFRGFRRLRRLYESLYSLYNLYTGNMRYPSTELLLPKVGNTRSTPW